LCAASAATCAKSLLNDPVALPVTSRVGQFALKSPPSGVGNDRLPTGALPPPLWGSDEHVREVFGDRVQSLEMTRRD
jgi:hypothetical protein